MTSLQPFRTAMPGSRWKRRSHSIQGNCMQGMKQLQVGASNRDRLNFQCNFPWVDSLDRQQWSFHLANTHFQHCGERGKSHTREPTPCSLFKSQIRSCAGVVFHTPGMLALTSIGRSARDSRPIDLGEQLLFFSVAVKSIFYA